MTKTLSVLILSSTVISVFSQSSDIEYDRIKVGEAKHIVSGLALSPDENKLAISGIQGFPLYIFDWKKEEVLKTFDAGNWYAGSAIDYSHTGKYILMGQLKYTDFAPNKDREVDFEIVDAETGQIVKSFGACHSVKITPDEKFALSLSGGEISFWDLSTGKKEKSFRVDQATNSVEISPDGKFIVVSHHLYESDAKAIPQLQRDKKSLKSALQYKQQLSVYDATSFKKLYTINELYDIVYKLKFSDDGQYLFCLNIPHMKIQSTPSGRQMYVQVIDMSTKKPVRRGYPSSAVYEPDFKLSHNGKLFGVVSQNSKFLEIHVYNFETGQMVERFQQAYRLFEKNEGDMLVADSRTAFVFMPDDTGILMTMGNHLIQWNFKQND